MTVEYRYQITCGNCGLISTEKTFNGAVNLAEKLECLHTACQSPVRIYDNMAHIGQPELFDLHGNVIARRQKK